jgi:hypothetical protein
MKLSSSKNLNATSPSLRRVNNLRRLTRAHALTLLVALAFISIVTTPASAGTNLKVQTATGISIIAAGADYASGFGAMNGLGVGTPAGGVSVQAVAGGALYYSTLNFQLQGGPSASVSVTAYVSTQFANPTALTAQSCPSTSSCTVSTSYQTLPTTSAAAIVVVPTLLKNASAVTASIAIFVPSNTSFSGPDSVVITFVANSGGVVDTTRLTLNNPQENVQTAIGMALSSDPSGVNVSNSTDFTLNFGNVNGLGISPAAGLTTSSVAGGILYSTPYRFKPSFSGFGVTTAKVSVYASMDFVHPAILELRDSTTSGGLYTAISKVPATPTVFGAGFSNASVNQRFLGLFVSSVNGATAFTGSDTAVLTFTTTPQ